MNLDCSISEEKKKLISEIFNTMSYGPVIESDSLAKGWLKKNESKFGPFINGGWIEKDQSKQSAAVKNPCTAKLLAHISLGNDDDISKAIHSSSNAFVEWSNMSGFKRAQVLYSIARNIQKHLQLFALVETISTGKPIHKTRVLDVPALIRSFYYYAGWAMLWDSEMQDWSSLGVICVAVEEYNNPVMSFCWHVASILASGNTITLLADLSSCLSALLLAEICSSSGLPPGVFNVVPVIDITFKFVSLSEVCKVVFTGSFKKSQELRKISAECQTDVCIRVAEQPTIIVFHDADLHSASDGVLEAFCFQSTKCKSGGCTVFVQDSVRESFLSKLKAYFQKLQIGTSLAKAELSGIVTEEQYSKLSQFINEAKEGGAEVLSLNKCEEVTSLSYPPTIVWNVQTSSKLVYDKVGGPIISIIPFRTVKEGIMLCNYNKNGSDVSIWCEKLTVALEVAHNLKTSTVWVNCQNEVDAAANYGGVYMTGCSKEGGKTALFQFVKPKWKTHDAKKICNEYLSFGETSNVDIELNSGIKSENALLDHTYKLYYGGIQKRPDSNTSRAVYNYKGEVIGQVPDGSRKDIRNAVECALAAQPKWQSKSAHNRAQILYYIAENIDCRKSEFASDMQNVMGLTPDACDNELKLTVERLFYWAACCDKYGGSVQETTMYGKVFETHEPLGVIGIICPDEAPLLSFISLLAPAVAHGNTVVIVPSEKYPVFALKLYQILDTSDVPGGVINIISGNNATLTRHLAFHMDVESIWFHHSSSIGNSFVRHAGTTNQKRVWIEKSRDWNDSLQGQGYEFILHATYNKTVWLPMGDIFAN